jgi:hypothetical protein
MEGIKTLVGWLVGWLVGCLGSEPRVAQSQKWLLSGAFQNFPGVSDLLPEASKFQHRIKLCSKCSNIWQTAYIKRNIPVLKFLVRITKEPNTYCTTVHIGFAKSLILYASFPLRNYHKAHNKITPHNMAEGPFIPLYGTIPWTTGNSVAGRTRVAKRHSYFPWAK